MAGHLPVKKTGFPRVISKSFKLEHLKKLEYFKKEKCLGVNIQRLPLDYAMDEEHGKVDEEILLFWKDKVEGEDQELHEIHFDKDMNINEVYLVM